MSTSRSRSASVPFILVVLLLDTLGIGVVIPVLPRLIASFVANDLATASTYYGAFVTVYAVMQVIFAPIIGALSDRFGRRVVILSSLFGAALDYLLLAFAPTLAWLFVGRVLAGITSASFSAATAYIADVTPIEKRAQSFGMLGAAFGMGFVIGPAIGGFLGSVDLRAPFMVAAALNGLNFVYGVFVLPESLRVEDRRPFSLLQASPFGTLKALTRSPTLLGLTGTIICWFLAQQIMQSIWALHTEARFGWSPSDIGLSLAVVGVSAVTVQGGVVRAVIPRLGERRALIYGLLFNAVGFVAFGFATQGWMMYVLIMPFALGGLAMPSIRALLSREVSASEQGQLQGSLSSLQSLAAVLAPAIATGLFARFAPEGSQPRIPGVAFFAAAALGFIGLVLALRLFARLPAPVTQNSDRAPSTP